MKKGRVISDDFGKLIKHYRELRKYSLVDLYNLTDVSVSYLNRLERGSRKSPSIPIAREICKALKMPYSYLRELLEIEDDSDSEQHLPDIEEMLMFQDYYVNGEFLLPESKEILSQIVGLIIDFEWKRSTIARDITLLSIKIEEFKEVT